MTQPSLPADQAAPAAPANAATKRRLEAVALAFVGLLFVLPFALPIHRLPQAAFDSEWIAGVLLAVGAVALGVLPKRFVPLNLLLPGWLIALVALAALQYATGMLQYKSQLALACVYAGAVGAAYWVARALLAGSLRDRVVPAIALCLVIGTVFSVSVQVLQLFDVVGLPEWLVLRIDDPWFRTRPFANVAQANILATYLVWGLFAVLYLFRRPIRLPATLVLLFIIAAGLALTRSRMGMLFALGFVAACWLPSALRPAAVKERWGVTSAALGGYLVGSFAVSLLVAFQGIAVETALGRFHESAGFSIRLAMWADALKVAAAHPLLGIGFGQYAVAQYALAQPSGLSTTYVHNFVLQTAAEMGWPLALALCALMLWWATAQLRVRAAVADAAFAWALLAVVTGHALLEWPFSTLLYLIPAGLLFGLAEPTVATRFARADTDSRGLIAAGVVGIVLALTMKLEFDEISDVHYTSESERRTQQGVSELTLQRLLGLSESSLLRVYADQTLTALRKIDALEPTDEEIQRLQRMMIAGVDDKIITRLVILNAKAGRIDESVRHAGKLRYFALDRYEAQRKVILEAIAKLGPAADPVRAKLGERAVEPANAAAPETSPQRAPAR